MTPDLRSVIANLAVIIGLTNSAYFTVSTEVIAPCTISASMDASSAVACGQGQMADGAARVSYNGDAVNGDMLMTVEF
jgi:hypothetical protein